MDKREFLKSSAAVAAAGMLSRLSSRPAAPAPRQNWAGNLTYSRRPSLRARTPSTKSAPSSSAATISARSAPATRSTPSPTAATTRSRSSSRLHRHRRQIAAPSPSARGSSTASSRPSSTPAATRCTISPRCRTSPSPAPSPPPRTAPACTTATSPPPSLRSNSSPPTAISFHLSREKDGEQFLGAVAGLGAARHCHPRHAQPAAHVPGRPVRLPGSVLRPASSIISTTSSAPATASAFSPTGRTIAPRRSGSSAASGPA